MKRLFRSVIWGVGLSIWAVAGTQAQEVLMKTPLPQGFMEAYDDYSAKNYSVSAQEWSELARLYPQRADVAEMSAFYRSAAACELRNKDADVLLTDFLNSYPHSSMCNEAYFLLADFYSREQNFVLSSQVYEKMDPSRLSQDKKYEYYYKYGHSLFQEGKLDDALAELDKVKGSKSKYSSPATYFFAHILYEQEKYSLALKEFLSLQEDKSFGRIVPYYIAQIYYRRGNYEELVKMADLLSEKSDSKRSGELNSMLGDAYYKLGRYREAVPYLEKAANEKGADAQDCYLLGFALMERGDYKEAKPYLSKACEKQDSLAQNALYHFGICCIETGDKAEAMAAFHKAYGLQGDERVKERSLLNYAKTSYETSPAFNESAKAFQLFTEQFPNSEYADEAKGYLAQMYGSMKNYRDAIEMIEQMSQRNLAVNKAYQRLCLNRAVELFNENRLDDAMIYLDKSLSQTHDNTLTATAYYLKAEAYFQMGEYNLSINNLNTFYSTPSADKSPYLSQADYAMGYNLFKQKKYALAKSYFQRAIGKIAEPQNSDAMLRYADCLFMGKEFNAAIGEYNKIANQKLSDADYACYQSAMAYGALGNYARKRDVLEQGYAEYKGGNYGASMKYELANAYLTLEDNKKAIENYESVIKLYPQSLHVKDCYAKIGMIYYKLGDDSKALAYLDKLVRQYPDTEEARSGLSNIKAIYVDQNRVEDFIAYTEKLPSAKISAGEQDSISYQAVENLYMEGDCANAIAGFKQYLHKYPQGAFTVSANYYLADCLNKISLEDEALQHYEAVTTHPKNVFTERSLLRSAQINFEKKQYDKAKEYYTRLEEVAEISSHKLLSIEGLMNTSYALHQFDTATMYANKLLSLDKIDQNAQENATYVLAKSLLANQNSGQAIEEFKKLTKAKNPEYAAEAQYTLAELAFKSGKTDEAEKIIHQINANPTSEYWLAKAFILWADIFQRKGNTLQANQTLQSIIDNYEGDEALIEQARERLLRMNEQTEKTNQENETQRQEHNQSVDEVIIEDTDNQ